MYASDRYFIYRRSKLLKFLKNMFHLVNFLMHQDAGNTPVLKLGMGRKTFEMSL